MIGRLQGTILEKTPPLVLLEVQGVGYEVEALTMTFAVLPEVGSSVTLHTHLIVREDAHILFGFTNLNERALFRALIKVNSVGPKLALAMLSGMPVETFIQCIQGGDVAPLVALPGVGKKTAQRLIIEMKDKLSTSSSNDWLAAIIPDAPGETKNKTRANPVQEAVSGLVALGYKPQEASRVVYQIKEEGMTCEELIRLALKEKA